MRKFYMYGQLFACLEFININESQDVYRQEAVESMRVSLRWDRQRMSDLLRNHRRKLNRMRIQHVRFLENEMVQLFQKLPVEPFPILDTEQKQQDVREGYTDQLHRLLLECKGNTMEEVV